MKYVLSGATVYLDHEFRKADLLIENGRIAGIDSSFSDTAQVFHFEGCMIFPGFVDVHVHLREPGFLYKESIETGTMAAARGGYTHVCSMPNLSPVPDCKEHLEEQLQAIEKDAEIFVSPYGSLTVGQQGEELSDMEAMAPFVAGFSDDGRGVQSLALMQQCMEKAKSLGKMIVAHCEDNSLLKGGYIHDGEYAKAHGHKGICSESEWKPIERDLELVKKTGCSYHVCHVSAKESVALIRKARNKGLDVTAETGPHYLVLDDSQLQEDGRFKMNPPIRSKEDQEALIEGLIDGTISMIATDHAPHSAEEKSKGLEKSMMGVVGLETAFPVLYTHLVKQGILTLEQLIALMHDNPSKRFGLGNEIGVGNPANFTVFDLNRSYRINPEDFVSKGKSTPFEGMEVFGACLMTVYQGNIVWKEEEK
ncbi:MAG: dihydroorotase [Ruminococcaceae bacterium]|nr:dihydroorotase [Oscillospiraceae bacterium]